MSPRYYLDEFWHTNCAAHLMDDIRQGCLKYETQRIDDDLSSGIIMNMSGVISLTKTLNGEHAIWFQLFPEATSNQSVDGN
jgi:hypothetical protein